MMIWQRVWKWLGTFLAGLAAGLLLYLGIRNKSVPESIKQGTKKATDQADAAVKKADTALEKSKEVIAESEKVLDEARKRRKARQERAKKLDSGTSNLLTIIFITLLFLLYTGTIHAQETAVPESYEDLRAAYLEQVKTTAEWKQLYQEAEQDNVALENEIEALQKHIKIQDEVIASLRDTIKELKAWITELYKTIADLSRRGLQVTVGAVLKPQDGKVTADGFIVGVTWP